MRYVKSLFWVLLSGTCTGLFFYVRTLPPLGIYVDIVTESDAFRNIPLLSHPTTYLFVTNVILLSIWLLYSFICSRITNRDFRSSLQLDAPTYLPLCILAVALFQFNTFFTYYFQILQILAQNAGYLLLLIAFLGVYYLKAENIRLLRRESTPRKKMFRVPNQAPTLKMKFLVFLVSFILYILIGLRIIDKLPLGGDEPHYLLITHSLLHDHDLAISNNYRQHDYQAFYHGELDPHVSIARDGTRYPGHPVGFPLLLVPAYALNGRQGVVLFINFLAALLAFQLYLIAYRFTQHASLSLLLWGLTSFTSPLLMYSSQIYPEIPSALLIAVAYYLIISFSAVSNTGIQRYRRKYDLFRSIALGLTLAVLPWLQQRMILPAVLLMIYYVITSGIILERKHWRNPSFLPGIIPILFLGVSGLTMASYYYTLYGNPLPNAPYSSVGIFSVFSRDILIKQGLLGLLFDQEAGLFIYSPYYLFLFAGVWQCVRHHRKQMFWLMLFILSIYLPCGGFTLKWRGSWSPASRYMMTLIPFFLVPVALSIKNTTRTLSRYILAFLSLISFSWSYIFLKFPSLSIMRGRGLNNVFDHSSNHIDLTRYFPSFTGTSSAMTYLLTAMWCVIIAVFSVVIYRFPQKQHRSENNMPSLPLENQPTGRNIKQVFALYSLVFVLLLVFTAIVEHLYRDKIPPQIMKNRQLRQMLSHFPSYALAREQYLPHSLRGQKDLRFEYIQKEKSGIVDQHGPRFIVTGPGEFFPKGRYTAYFTIFVDDNSSREFAATLEIVSHHGTRAYVRKDLRGSNFSASGKSEVFPLTFALREDVKDLETRVYFHNTINLKVTKITIEPDLADFYYETGMSALWQKQYSEAKMMFLRALSISTHVQALYQLALLEQLSENWQASLEILQNVLTFDPNFADAHYRLGIALRNMGEPEKASYHFKQATHLLPTHLDAWLALQSISRQLNMQKQTTRVTKTLETLYAPQHPYAVNIANQLLFMGYSIYKSGAETYTLEYYWKALASMNKDYFFFIMLDNDNTHLYYDQAPQIVEKTTNESKPYYTSKWKIGELFRGKMEIPVSKGMFTMHIGVWDPFHTQQQLPIISSEEKFSFTPQTRIELQTLDLQ